MRKCFKAQSWRFGFPSNQILLKFLKIHFGSTLTFLLVSMLLGKCEKSDLNWYQMDGNVSLSLPIHSCVSSSFQSWKLRRLFELILDGWGVCIWAAGWKGHTKDHNDLTKESHKGISEKDLPQDLKATKGIRMILERVSLDHWGKSHHAVQIMKYQTFLIRNHWVLRQRNPERGPAARHTQVTICHHM